MDSIITNITGLESAFSSLFSFLPAGWGVVLSAALSLFFIYIVVKFLISLVGMFF